MTLVIVKGEDPGDHCLRSHSNSVNLGTLHKLCFFHLKMSEIIHRADSRVKRDHLHKGLNTVQ